MNEIFRKPTADASLPGTSPAGDELPRRRWTASEVQQMLAAGILDDRDRLELIGGDLIAMSPKGQHHELLKIALNLHFADNRSPEITFAQETPLHLSDDTEPEPDFVVYPRALKPADVRGDTVLLVVEIADSSLGRDLGGKAALYASFGVREYWVINAVERRAVIHHEPGALGYASVVEVSGHERIVPALAPSLAVRLDDLEL